MNQNIWCIEIIQCYLAFVEPNNLNQNIWCIEIYKRNLTMEIMRLEPKHMMYWNLSMSPPFGKSRVLEPKHMMYWNRHLNKRQKGLKFLEPKHMMYWNLNPYALAKTLIVLNQNIWCIEICKIYYKILFFN